MTRPENDPLHDRLSSFGQDGPLPDLAPPSTVRARGAQRRSRARAALAGAGASVLLLAGGGAYALLDEPTRASDTLDAADPSPAASATPTCVTGPGPFTGPDAELRACETATPTATPAALAPVPAALLLQSGDAERVSGGDWQAQEVQDVDPPVLLVCSGTSAGSTTGVLRSLSRGRTSVLSQVVRHDRSADEVLSTLRDDVRRCPQRAEDSEDGQATVQSTLSAGPVQDSVSVRQVSRDTPDSPGTVRQWVVLAGDDGLVSYTSLPDPERDRELAWAQAARARLDGTTAPPPSASPSAEPSPSPSPSPGPAARDLTRHVLDVDDAARAEPGPWKRDGFADEGPVLDPCPGGTRYPVEEEKLSDASTILSSTREAGGTAFVQQVGQYPDSDVAEAAAAGYLRAVRGCSTSAEEGTEPRTVRYQVLRTTTVGGATTSYVRRTSTCPEGCVAVYVYYAVQQRGDLVSVLSVSYGEDGDPGADVVEPFAAQAARALAP